MSFRWTRNMWTKFYDKPSNTYIYIYIVISSHEGLYFIRVIIPKTTLLNDMYMLNTTKAHFEPTNMDSELWDIIYAMQKVKN